MPLPEGFGVKDKAHSWIWLRLLLLVSLDARLPKIKKRISLFSGGNLSSSPAQLLKATFRLLHSSPDLRCWGKEVISGRKRSSPRLHGEGD
jgi:hypothetical protein